MSTCKALLSKITNKNAFYEQEDMTQTNQIDVKVIDVVCKIIDEVSFAGADSVMHGTIEKMAEH